MLLDLDLTTSKVMSHLSFRKTWKDVIDTLADINLTQCQKFLEDELSYRFAESKSKFNWLGIPQSQFTKVFTTLDELNFTTVTKVLEKGKYYFVLYIHRYS